MSHVLTFDIRDFSVENHSLASPSINAAVKACAAAGGGTVLVPAGEWTCGTIELASNVNLHLETGAVLRSSLELGDFYPLEGMLHGKALLAAKGCENISITGQGCIDGRGHNFMDWSRTYPPQGRWDDAFEGPAYPKERIDRLVYFDTCKNVRVSGIRLIEPAQWGLTMICCEDIWCTDLFIYGHERIPNNDGIHLCYCRKVTIHGCHIHTADDAIALTSERGGNSDEDALHWSAEEMVNPPWCEQITISDCVLSSRGSGVRIGFMDDFVRDVRIHDCILPSVHRGFLVSARNNGRVENVLVHDCRVVTHLWGGVWWGGAEPFQISGMGAGSGHIRNIEFHNIDAESEHGALLWTDARFPISDVCLRDVRIRLQNSRNAATLGGYFDLRPRSVERDIPSGYFKHEIPGIYAQNILDLQVRDCKVTFPLEPASYFTVGIHLSACTGTDLRENQASSHVQDDNKI